MKKREEPAHTSFGGKQNQNKEPSVPIISKT
jgi:hypothetical protein